MSMSYFRRRAARSYRDARSSHAPPLEYENLMKLGSEFKARATAAEARLAGLRDAVLLREEAERQDFCTRKVGSRSQVRAECASIIG
jgi:hypothetical protein